MEPSVVAKDHGIGPSSCVSRSLKSILRLSPITNNRAKRFLSAFTAILFPSLRTVAFLVWSRNVPRLSLLRVSKKPLLSPLSRSSTNDLRADEPP